MNSISPASPTCSADPAVGVACDEEAAARRARLLGIIVRMEDIAAGLIEAFARQAHEEMAAAKAARDAAPIGELVPHGAGVRSAMACDRLGRMLRLAILLEERVAEGMAGLTAPAPRPAARPVVTPERLDALDAPEQVEANERIDRLENEVLRADRSVESYLAELFGEMERELRGAGKSEAEIEAHLGAARAELAAVWSEETVAAAVASRGMPGRGDAAPVGVAVVDPPNRGPP